MSTTKQRNYYRNGQLNEETPLRDGRFHGIARLWHKNGTPATQEAYQNDLRHGLCRQWNDEGKLLGEYRMDHGTGIQRVWFDNGIVQREQSFFKGKATGPCRMWLRDGSFASEEWYIDYREVSKAQFAKAATKHPEWPPDPRNGTTHRKLPRATLKKRAYRLNCKWLLAQSDTKDAAQVVGRSQNGYPRCRLPVWPANAQPCERRSRCGSAPGAGRRHLRLEGRERVCRRVAGSATAIQNTPSFGSERLYVLGWAHQHVVWCPTATPVIRGSTFM